MNIFQEIMQMIQSYHIIDLHLISCLCIRLKNRYTCLGFYRLDNSKWWDIEYAVSWSLHPKEKNTQNSLKKQNKTGYKIDRLWCYLH